MKVDEKQTKIQTHGLNPSEPSSDQPKVVIAGLLMILLSFAPYLKDICGPSSVEVVEEIVEEVEEVTKDN